MTPSVATTLSSVGLVVVVVALTDVPRGL